MEGALLLPQVRLGRIVVEVFYLKLVHQNLLQLSPLFEDEHPFVWSRIFQADHFVEATIELQSKGSHPLSVVQVRLAFNLIEYTESCFYSAV